MQRAQARVLMVEDEMVLAFMLEDLLREAGFAVERAARIDDALALLEAHEFHVAVLDVNLGGQPVFPLADCLLARSVPILFTTGYGAGSLPVRYAGCAVLSKPYPPDQLAPTVFGLIGDATSRVTTAAAGRPATASAPSTR